MMKNLPHFLLILFIPLMLSCTEGLQETTPVELTPEEIMENRLSYLDNSILLGKVNINDYGRWKEGWVLDKSGMVWAIDFSQLSQPAMHTLDLESLAQIMNIGKATFQIENKMDMANHYFDLDDIPNSMELENKKGDSYFAIVEFENATPEVEVINCGGGEGSDFSLFTIKMLSNHEEVLNHKEAIEAVSWLSTVSNELN